MERSLWYSDGRAETSEDWLFQVQNYVESGDADVCLFLTETEDHGDEVGYEWRESNIPEDTSLVSSTERVVGRGDLWEPSSDRQES